MAGLEVRPVRGRTDLALFIDLPWRIYRDDPNWVPPLKASVRELLDMDRHPFYGGGKDAEIELFLAWEGRRVVGRVAAILNRAHNRFHGENIGFFGFFESEDRPEVAEGLMAAAENWAISRKLDALRGPANPSTNYECGLLIEGFDGPPVLMMTYNPQYYMSLLEGAGYAKVKDLYAFISPRELWSLDRLGRLVERSRRRHPGLVTRKANLRDFRGEVRLVQEIYNDAWEKNWGFIPMSEGEINWMARELKPLVQPDLLRFAFLDGEVAGFLLAVPDWNPVLKDLDGSPWKHPFRMVKHLLKSKPETMEGLRVITMGVKQKFRKRGIEGILVFESIREALRIGYAWSEYSWILEDNELVQGTIKIVNGRRYRTYRLYEKPIG